MNILFIIPQHDNGKIKLFELFKATRIFINLNKYDTQVLLRQPVDMSEIILF